MQIKTLLKASTLALDIINHQSTQSLSKLVQNGVKRRVNVNKEQHSSAPMPRSATSTASTRTHTRQPVHRVPPSPPMMTAPLPVEPVKKALKYVTPENVQKAMQWQEIVRSFFTKN